MVPSAETAAAGPLSPAQATEYQSHKWTVYMRSPTGEDLTYALKKASAEQPAEASCVFHLRLVATGGWAKAGGLRRLGQA